jgi:hypothetical protein
MWNCIGILIASIVILLLYNQSKKRVGDSMFNFLFLVMGIIAGIAIAYFLLKGTFGFGKTDTTSVSAHTIVQRVERVFKVVTAEGHFSEIYDYSNTSHVLSFIPSTKKALIVVNAKVMMGYDFKKLKWEVDANKKVMRILEFPAPEILSIEPDMKYYNLENGLFNKFSNVDITKLQIDAKLKISESVDKSELPKIAERQMQAILQEMTDLGEWHLQGATTSPPLLLENKAVK